MALRDDDHGEGSFGRTPDDGEPSFGRTTPTESTPATPPMHRSTPGGGMVIGLVILAVVVLAVIVGFIVS